jgi:hypothetical protein
MTVVLDSWVVLRHLENTDPAATLIDDLLDDGRPLVSWINNEARAASLFWRERLQSRSCTACSPHR